MFLPHPRMKVSIAGSFRDREVACSASDRQGSNFESCVWKTVSSQSSHHPQEVLLAQFSLYVHKGGLKPDSFHFIRIDLVQLGEYMSDRSDTTYGPIIGPGLIYMLIYLFAKSRYTETSLHIHKEAIFHRATCHGCV